MTAKHKNIEKRFIRELENLELQPSPQVWEKVSARLAWKEFMQFNPQAFNVYYAVALLGFALLTIYITVFRNNTKDLLSPEPEPRTEISGSSLIPSDESGKALSLDASADSSILDITQTDFPEIEKTSTVQPSAPVAEKFTQQTPTTTPTDSSLTNLSIHSPEDTHTLLRPVALFSPSVTEGCVPLKVWFSNYSVNALQYSWSFSDGGTSESMNPIYVFDEPGEYEIRFRLLWNPQDRATASAPVRVTVLEWGAGEDKEQIEALNLWKDQNIAAAFQDSAELSDSSLGRLRKLREEYPDTVYGKLASALLERAKKP